MRCLPVLLADFAGAGGDSPTRRRRAHRRTRFGEPVLDPAENIVMEPAETAGPPRQLFSGPLSRRGFLSGGLGRVNCRLTVSRLAAMHEMSLAEGIVQLIEDAARDQGFASVRAVWLEIGRLSSVETGVAALLLRRGLARHPCRWRKARKSWIFQGRLVPASAARASDCRRCTIPARAAAAIRCRSPAAPKCASRNWKSSRREQTCAPPAAAATAKRRSRASLHGHEHAHARRRTAIATRTIMSTVTTMPTTQSHGYAYVPAHGHARGHGAVAHGADRAGHPGQEQRLCARRTAPSWPGAASSR